jgi:hypothetical protein
MGFAFVIIGLLMIVTGGRGTYAQFGSQIASEFQGGKGSFTYWFIALAGIGALGYIPALQTISRWAMSLIILSIFLSHKGFFAQFQAALAKGPTQPQALVSSNSSTASNPSGGPTIDLGPLGSINENPIVPGGALDKFLTLFGLGSTPQVAQ